MLDIISTKNELLEKLSNDKDFVANMERKQMEARGLQDSTADRRDSMFNLEVTIWPYFLPFFSY